MARGRKDRTKTKGSPVSGLQRIIDRESNADAMAPLVNGFAAYHGDYQQLGKFQDARHAMVNRGGTPIARWTHAGLLSDSQQAAIAHCINLWGMLNGRSLVADFQRIAGASHGDGYNEQFALSELASIKGYVPAKYWSVFENVCRFDEPAGVAGSKIEATDRNKEVAARLCVAFVADVISMRERLTY